MRGAPRAAAVAAAMLLAGCGTGGADQPRAPQAASSARLRAELKGATQARASDFPPARGRTLQQLAGTLDLSGPQVGLAGTVFTVGENRLAFGVIDPRSGFVYGKTAVYVAEGTGASARARGPSPAPADRS
jgi:hypothetical protein